MQEEVSSSYGGSVEVQLISGNRPNPKPCDLNMEAKALHDFKASSPDELSFDKGSIVKVSPNHIDQSHELRRERELVL